MDVGTQDSALLDQIEDDVLGGHALADALRKCVVLGGRAGSRDLRRWASCELKGYSATEEAPPYRTVGASILCDVSKPFGGYIKAAPLGATALPDFVRDAGIGEEYHFLQGVGAIEALIERARSEGGHLKLALPMSAEICREMDRKVGDDYQSFTRIYWHVDQAALEGIVDQVRNTLTELIAELRATTPRSSALPTREATDQAVNVAVNGDRSTITVSTVTASSGSTAKLATASAAEPDESTWWTRSKVLGAAIGGIASVVGLGLALLQWRGWL